MLRAGGRKGTERRNQFKINIKIIYELSFASSCNVKKENRGEWNAKTFWENEKCSMWTDTICFPTGHRAGANKQTNMKTTGK